MDIRPGDVLTMKKQHPCGSNTWTVLRIGADFKMVCQGCGHEIMSSRSNIEKHIRKVLRDGEPVEELLELRVEEVLWEERVLLPLLPREERLWASISGAVSMAMAITRDAANVINLFIASEF